MAWVMMSAALAAVAWGISDFLAGLLARRVPVLTILIGSKVAAMLLALLAAAVWGTLPPGDARLGLAIGAGLVGLPAMGLLYRAMRDGSLAVVAPVAAVAALVPVVWGLLHGERLGLGAGVGVATGLVGATMASWPVADLSRRRRQQSANLCALGAALGFGVYFVLLHEAAVADQFWSVALARITEGVAALVLAAVISRKIAVGRPYPRPPGGAAEPTDYHNDGPDCPQPPTVEPSYPQSVADGLRSRTRLLALLGAGLSIPIFVVGATDAIADAAFIVAASTALAPAAVVASLYPAVTLLLNRSLLRERLHTVHLYGVLAALFAIACLAR